MTPIKAHVTRHHGLEALYHCPSPNQQDQRESNFGDNQQCTHPEMGYRACLGIQSLAKAYSHPRLEAACRRALEGQACSYPSLKSILKRGLDGQPTRAQEPERSSPQHENLRGGHYYQSPTKLVQ